MINILLVEGEYLFSEGIKAILSDEEDFHVAGIAAGKEKAFDLIEEQQPDVVIANIHQTSIDGAQLTIRAKAKYPDVKVVLFITELDGNKAVECVLAGVDGMLMHSIDSTNLHQIIRNAHQGQTIFAGEVARILAERVVDIKYNKKIVLGRKLASRSVVLTDRELDVAHLIARNNNNRNIAKNLQLAEGTIKNYVSNLYDKLDVNDRSEMIELIQKLLPS